MDEKTLNALKESIAHWERMRDGKRVETRNRYAVDGDLESIGPDDCALCNLFYKAGCFECPIMEDTGESQCSNCAPYLYATHVLDRDFLHDSPEFKRAAQEMIDYLKSLLPEGECTPAAPDATAG